MSHSTVVHGMAVLPQSRLVVYQSRSQLPKMFARQKVRTAAIKCWTFAVVLDHIFIAWDFGVWSFMRDM